MTEDLFTWADGKPDPVALSPAPPREVPFGCVSSDLPDELTDADEIRAYWWATRGGLDSGWWAGLPEYERRNWFMRYGDVVRHTADDRPLPTPRHVIEAEDESYQRNKEHAMLWAHQLEEAWKEGKPCPIRPTPEFRWLLDWAFRLAKVPTTCFSHDTTTTDSEEETGTRRPRNRRKAD